MGGKETDDKEKKKRVWTRRDGEQTAAELRAALAAHGGCHLSKKQLRESSKLGLCDEALRLGIIDNVGYDSSLARRKEGHKAYLSTFVRNKYLRATIDLYVIWWSETIARGSLIANQFAAQEPELASWAALMDLTFLKKLIAPERYDADQRPQALNDFIGARNALLGAMLPSVPTDTFPRTLGDQAVTYMARRHCGNIKVHVLTHLHRRIFELFAARRPRDINTPRQKELPVALRRLLVTGIVDGSLATDDIILALKLRETLGAPPEGHIGKPFDDDATLDAVQEDGAGGEEEDDPGVQDTTALVNALGAHRRLVAMGVTTMLPIATLARNHAIIDKRIALCLVKMTNCRLAPGNKLRADSEAVAFERYMVPHIAARRRAVLRAKKRVTSQPKRRQFKRSGLGEGLIPKGAEASSLQTDGVSASLAFDVAIRHRVPIMMKVADLKMTLPTHQACASSSSTSPPPKTERPWRRIAVDPGDNNIITSAELGRPPKAPHDAHRSVVHSHLSKRFLNRRSRLDAFKAWEAQRRQESPAYGAMRRRPKAGTKRPSTRSRQPAPPPRSTRDSWTSTLRSGRKHGLRSGRSWSSSRTAPTGR